MNKRTDNDGQLNHQPGRDLDWLAWCFVTGDLTDDQIVGFQGRMETEPEVVDAVARAVELYGCCEAGLAASKPVVAGLPEAVFASSGSSNGHVRLDEKRATWASKTRSWRLTAVLSAAAVVLVLVSVAIRWSGEAAQRASDDENLAATWAEQLDSGGSWDLASMLEDDIELLMAVEGDPADMPDVDGQGWIFAAAIALDGIDFDSDDDQQQVF